MDIAVADPVPVFKLNAKLERAADRGQHFGFVDAEQSVETDERWNRCLTDTDRADGL